MNNSIQITYDAKTKRLVMKVPFHLADVARGFPSRRFDPKSKTWKMPMVKANIRHLNETGHIYGYHPDDEATQAIKDFMSADEGVKYVPFPRHIYKFDRAKVPYQPMPHQDRMLDTSWGLKASAWFAKMGTGKTFGAIHLAMARWEAGLIDGVMIICPSTLRHTWRKELAKYATREYDYRIHDTKAGWLQEFYRGDTNRKSHILPILAVSVEGLGVSEALYDSACGFMLGRRVMCICDESSRIKSPKAKRTDRAIQLGAASEYRLILNGTPIALGIQDLWSQYEFLDPNIMGYGDYWAFKTRHIMMGGYENKQIIGVAHVDELMKLIIPYTVEVGKDVLNLLPKVPKEFTCVPTQEQKDLFYQIVKGKARHANPQPIKVTNVLERNLRLQQVIGGWLPYAHSTLTEIDGETIEKIDTVLVPLADNPKMDLLLTTIEDNMAGSKFIIWTGFTHEIEFISGQLAKLYGPNSVECYYGKTAMEDRSRIEDRYCNDPTMRFFVGNPSAAGLGLTLISQENDVMLYYTATNHYIDRAQSEDRAHRIGQQNSVVIGDFVMEKTLDEVIQQSIQAKMDVEEYIMTRIAAGINVDDMLLGV
jgi:SNF2 family DNA or RNA helicase